MEILGKSIVELKRLLEKKQLSSKELFSYFQKRIEKYNSKLNAFLTTVKEKNAKGIPIAVKDNFCTKGVRTTASSKVLDDFIPPYESTVTQRLKGAGFGLLGKTNMDAWAHGASTETSDFGPTKNPWDVTRVPGGSSGGSAASIAAYLSPAAIGSETAGSIRGPAAWCGIVGLKPTYGRVSRYGVIAMGSSLDCPGPLTLTVEDAALFLEILAGKDPFDATTADVAVGGYIQTLRKSKKFTIGIAEEYFDGVQDEVKEKVYQCINALVKMGHKTRQEKLMHPKYAISVYTIIQRSEVSSNLARYEGIRYGNNRDSFTAEAKKRIMLGTYTLSYGYYDAYYKKAQKVRTLLIDDFKRVFQDVDVIVGPTMPFTALKLGDSEKYPFFGEQMDILAEPAAIAGLPAISIPVGLDGDGLPIGMQIMGKWFAEESILNLAHQIEKETEFFGVIKKGVERYKD